MLLVATVVALALASSPWAASYRALLDTPLGIAAGWIRDRSERALHRQRRADDHLFFVVGLEIKRELTVGELSAVAGIGFTIALFVAELAFIGRPVLHASATLATSVLAAILAVVAVRASRCDPP